MAFDEAHGWRDQMFGTHAAFFDALSGLKSTQEVFALLRRLGFGEVRQVLDLCCGNGRLAPELCKIAQSYVGVDVSTELLELALRRYKHLPNASFVHCDARHLIDSLPRERFDLILRNYTSLGYFCWDSEVEMLKQCSMVASPGASMIVDSFNGDWFIQNHHVKRSKDCGRFRLIEDYRCSGSGARVECEWRYVESGQEDVVISFRLEQYNVQRVVELASAAGWVVREVFADYSDVLLSDTGVVPERLVARLCKPA